jgi:hypothetical protein
MAFCVEELNHLSHADEFIGRLLGGATIEQQRLERGTICSAHACCIMAGQGPA